MITTLKKYWKIEVALGIVILVFMVYFIGSCNGKKNVNPLPADSLKILEKKYSMRDSLLSLDNAELKRMDIQKTDSIRILNRQMALNKTEVIITGEKAKKLPLDSAILLMAYGFKDKTPITCIAEDMDTGVVITPRDVKEVNTTKIMKDYFKNATGLLRKEVKLYCAKDSLKGMELKNDSMIIADKGSTIVLEQEKNAGLTKDLATMTRSMKKQRFFKYIFEGTTLVAIIFAALK